MPPVPGFLGRSAVWGGLQHDLAAGNVERGSGDPRRLVWKRNLSPGVPVRLRINGGDHRALAEVVSDPGTAAARLVIMIKANPSVSRFSGIQLDANGQPEPDRLRLALDNGFAIVRWHLQ
jgi:hypothetical protein